MASIAQSAVLVHSTLPSSAPRAQASAVGGAESAEAVVIRGPAPTEPLAAILARYASLGFQASLFAKAVRIGRAMLQRRDPSKVFLIKDGNFEEVKPQVLDDEEEESKKVNQKVRPLLFFGITANLLGTACRDAVRYIVKEGIEKRATISPPPPSGVDAAVAGSEDEEELERLRQLWCEHVVQARQAALAPSSPHAFALPRYKSFVSAVVVSGGGIEHDLRQACAAAAAGEGGDGGTGYQVAQYSSEKRERWLSSPSCAAGSPSAQQQKDEDAARRQRFGNVEYQQRFPLFDALMRKLVQRLLAQQQQRREAYLREQQDAQKRRQQQEARGLKTAAAAVEYVVCPWAIAPSEVWALTGLWLPSLLAEVLTEQQQKEEGKKAEAASRRAAEVARRAQQLAETTAVYWAALQGVPIFCPSFADGDIMAYLLPSSSSSPSSPSSDVVLKLDLVRDIHALNKLAMHSRSTAMLICGGGSIKHHICNANLMRNGADLSVFVNNGMEFDGSDGGAKPEEALSWGKVRVDGDFVKVQSEVSLVLPLLVAEVFVPAVRERDREEEEPA